MIVGGLEAGGTKMVCCVGDERGSIQIRESIPTTTPEETIPRLASWFLEHPVEALGIGSFGPVDLHPDSRAYGSITTTPKPGWKHVSLYAALRMALGIPVGFDTDVNAAGFAEYRLGAGRGYSSTFYVTVGTGIGAGIVAENQLIHGLVHPEFGHILLRPHPEDPTPKGFCPFHTACLEGLASGPALEKRWGIPARDLPPEHIAWAIEAEYLSQMCANALFTLSPEVIVLGGGVMHQRRLFPLIRRRTSELLGGYVAHPRVMGGMEDMIVPPALGDNAGAAGCLLLAAEALARSQ